jgi:hypothetical protein
MAKVTSLKNPLRVNPDAMKAFVEGDTGAKRATVKGVGASRAENAPTGLKSGLLPTGDVRLTANINSDLHLKLKIRAAQERTTVGELIEQWIKGW